MERRLLLAGSASFANGRLTVTGSSGADTISVYESGGTVLVSGVDPWAGESEGNVTEIRVDAGSGSDHITIDDSIAPSVSITLNGEGGGDTLFSEAGPATMNGEAGNDLLSGADHRGRRVKRRR